MYIWVFGLVENFKIKFLVSSPWCTHKTETYRTTLGVAFHRPNTQCYSRLPHLEEVRSFYIRWKTVRFELILAEKEGHMPRRRHTRDDRKRDRSRSRGRSRGHSRGRSHGRSRSRSYTDSRRSRALPLALPVRISVWVSGFIQYYSIFILYIKCA